MPPNIHQSELDGLGCRIKECFPCNPFCGEAVHFEDRPELDEKRALLAALSGRTWCDVAPGFIEQNPDAFVQLEDEAFPYFFAAWLSMSLVSDVVTEYLIYTFSPHAQRLAEWTLRTGRPLESMTSSQKAVLLDVLKVHLKMAHSNYFKQHAQKAVDFVFHYIVNVAPSALSD